MKAVKGELQEREKGMPYLKEINFLKNFIENKSNNLSFEITVGSFNGKLYKIKYEADFNGSETFWRHPSELSSGHYDGCGGIWYNYWGELRGRSKSYPSLYYSLFVTRKISIMCNDGRKLTIWRRKNINNIDEDTYIDYEVATEEGKAFYPYKFSSEELNYLNKMYIQKIAEAMISQEEKIQELKEETKIFVKKLGK